MTDVKYAVYSKDNPTEFVWVTTPELKRRTVELDRKIDEGIRYLERLRLAGKHDTPEYNRVFDPWERLVAEYNRCCAVLEYAELARG